MRSGQYIQCITPEQCAAPPLAFLHAFCEKVLLSPARCPRPGTGEGDAAEHVVGDLHPAGEGEIDLGAAVCHGPAGLLGARRADGRPLVEGLRVSAFTDAEEEAVGLSGVVPFRLESRLRELGARFAGAANWQPFAVRDGQLITGQNPMSSALVAGEVLGSGSLHGRSGKA